MRIRRGLVLAALVAVPMQLGAVPLGARAASAAPPTGASAAVPSAEPDEASAMAAARAGRTRVEVSGMRSETQQVFANPDGTLTLTQNLQPVRVHRPDGSWVPVDTSLHARAEGSVVPGAVPVDLVFSGGGSGPLVRMSRRGRSLALSWPISLPAPTVSGDTAVYPDVVPGADLRVRVSAVGFSEELVVRTRAAAVNPALRVMRFGMAAPGMVVRADANGGLRAVDSASGTVFSMSAPTMSDSPVPAALPEGGAGPVVTGAGPAAGVPGAHRARLGVALSPGALSVSSDESILTSPDTVLPLTITYPSVSYGNPSWTEVNAEDPNSATWRTTPTSLAVGFQDFESPWSRVRSFIHFPLDSRIYGATIRSATLGTFESWSSSCTPTAVELWVTGGFSGSTTWNHQPTWGSHLSNQIVAKGHDSTCAAGGVEFAATSGVAGAAKNHSSITFGLKAGDETTDLSWKKFNVTPSLTVVYNHTPPTPTAATMSTSSPNSSCVNDKTKAPHVNVLPGTGITLRVRATDPDNNKVKVTFDFRQDFGASALANPTSAAFSSGTTVTATVMTTPALTDGTIYAWNAFVRDVDAGGNVLSTSGTSAWCYIVQDSTVPNEPVVTSTDYPTDAYAGGAGQPGIFTFTQGASTDSDLAGYLYGVDQETPGTFVAADANGNASPAVAPPSYGPHDLDVRAKDTAGNLSPVVSYHFYADSPTDATAYWKFDEGSGSTAVGTIESDPGNTGGPAATLSPTGVSWTTAGKVGDALTFDGATGTVSADTARIDTSQSFTVTAWVRLTSKGNAEDAVTQDGTEASGFYLHYHSAADRWRFAMPRSDTVGPVVDHADSTAPAQTGVWTHLAGVYDSVAHQLRLYVNGTLASTVSHTAWDAPGKLRIGQGMWNGAAADPWVGDIDEVRVYQRVLTAGEIDDIINHDNAASPVGSWDFDETTGTTAADTSGHDNPMTLATGASFTTAGHANGGLALDGVTGTASATSAIRTDQSFTVAAWVNLSNADQVATVASQDGTNTSGFVLQFQPTSDGLGQWVFALAPDDGVGSVALTPAVVGALFPLDEWVHLAGVYDAFTHTLELTVADDFNTRVNYGMQPTPWNASGPLLVGRDLTVDVTGAVAPGDYLAGTVDEVRSWAGTLTESELSALDAL